MRKKLYQFLKDMKRLYVLIDKNLDPVYGCVQGGHAVAQWLLEHPEQKWNNSYLIYLNADIEKWNNTLIYKGIDFSRFYEPDLGGRCTAIAAESDGRIFKNLKLVKVCGEP